eukprot:scaffold1574_cov373-Prasinococcus_capsulatus_cf.AAC.14
MGDSPSRAGQPHRWSATAGTHSSRCAEPGGGPLRSAPGGAQHLAGQLCAASVAAGRPARSLPVLPPPPPPPPSGKEGAPATRAGRGAGVPSAQTALTNPNAHHHHHHDDDDVR